MFSISNSCLHVNIQLALPVYRCVGPRVTQGDSNVAMCVGTAVSVGTSVPAGTVTGCLVLRCAAAPAVLPVSSNSIRASLFAADLSEPRSSVNFAAEMPLNPVVTSFRREYCSFNRVGSPGGAASPPPPPPPIGLPAKGLPPPDILSSILIPNDGTGPGSLQDIALPLHLSLGWASRSRLRQEAGCAPRAVVDLPGGLQRGCS